MNNKEFNFGLWFHKSKEDNKWKLKFSISIPYLVEYITPCPINFNFKRYIIFELRLLKRQALRRSCFVLFNFDFFDFKNYSGGYYKFDKSKPIYEVMRNGPMYFKYYTYYKAFLGIPYCKCKSKWGLFNDQGGLCLVCDDEISDYNKAYYLDKYSKNVDSILSAFDNIMGVMKQIENRYKEKDK